jgi:hypothetical protein
LKGLTVTVETFADFATKACEYFILVCDRIKKKVKTSIMRFEVHHPARTLTTEEFLVMAPIGSPSN